MEREVIKQKVYSIFKAFFRDENLAISESTTANDVEKWDSLSHISLISVVEKEFYIQIRLKELIAMKNVGDLIEIIYRKKSEKYAA
jgi:acyl carrier protein